MPPQLPGRFDGPPGSDAGGHERSRSRGRSRTRTELNPVGRPDRLNKNLELGPEAYRHGFLDPIAHMQRPAFLQTGKEVSMRVNAYRVETFPTKSVWQYDVVIGKGEAEKRALLKAVWNSKLLQNQLGNGWIFDGNKLAWSLTNIGQKTISIDMDVEHGRPSRGDNFFRVQLRPTKTVQVGALQAYLNQQTSFGTEVLEAINFLDHLLREVPSKKLLNIKRSFYDMSLGGLHDIGHGLAAMKGIYQSLRCAEGKKLIVNADVSNTVFWRPGPLIYLLTELAAPVREVEICIKLSEPRSETSVLRIQVDKLRKLRIKVKYNNMPERFKDKVFMIESIPKTNVRNTMFEKEVDGRPTEVSVWDYFLNDKGHRLMKQNLPCVRTAKGQLFPVEVCEVIEGQRYIYKLNEIQVSSLIKYAATRPPDRLNTINNGIKALDWQSDPFHRNYGLKINPNMIETKARILQAPSVEFRGGKTERPGTSGRWRIDGKQFLRPAKPLSRWAVCVFNNLSKDPRSRASPDEVNTFLRTFIIQFKAYGGEIEDRIPPIVTHDDLAKGVEMAHEKATQGNEPPQLLIFIVNQKQIAAYNRIKKNAECRFGVVSQCLHSLNVKKNQLQWHGNVMMKVFAKLGGFAFRANPNQNVKPGPKPEAVRLLPPMSMLIGADVSHAAPGSFQPSMAALTVSMDHSAMRFAAGVQTNGHRIEMITDWNLVDMFVPLLREWTSTVGGGKYPKHIFYFRDGVSEGQYQHVLQREVRSLKHILSELDNSPKKDQSAAIKWTVIVASKRHHIRFFPKDRSGDRNGNAFAGTVIERDVTHPTEYDFYLCSHSAIQGTARPVHYHVLKDESGGTPDVLVKMIYNLCYQYARSSTPVSMIPAVYYAHLASKRALAHERRSANEDFKFTGKDLSDFVMLESALHECEVTGKMLTPAAIDRLRELSNMKIPPLLNMPESGTDRNKIRMSMWYI